MLKLKPLPEGEVIVYSRGFTPKAPAPGSYSYFIRNGSEILEETVYVPNPATQQYLDLTALVAALSSILHLKPIQMVIYLRSAYLRDCLPNLPAWEEKNYITSHSTPVRHDKLWRLLYLLKTLPNFESSYWIESKSKLWGDSYTLKAAKKATKTETSIPFRKISFTEWREEQT